MLFPPEAETKAVAHGMAEEADGHTNDGLAPGDEGAERIARGSGGALSCYVRNALGELSTFKKNVQQAWVGDIFIIFARKK